MKSAIYFLTDPIIGCYLILQFYQLHVDSKDFKQSWPLTLKPEKSGNPKSKIQNPKVRNPNNAEIRTNAGSFT